MLSLAKDPRTPNLTDGHSQGGELNQKHHTTYLHSSYPPILLSLAELKAKLRPSHIVIVSKRLILYKIV